MLVRLDHVASVIVNANHGTMSAAVVFRVADCIRDRIGIAIPQTTEWQHIGDEINTAFILARADFVKVLRSCHRCGLGFGHPFWDSTEVR